MYILGISCFYHDSAAALIKDGEVVAAASEERFTRIKHDYEFPKNACEWVMKQAGITIKDIAYVGFYDKPLLKFERIIFAAVRNFPKSLPTWLHAIPTWMKQKLWIPHIIREELNYEGEVLFAEHHMSHAASSFLCSPFEEAALLTLDGIGEWATATTGVGRGSDIQLLKEIRYPHSLGMLYSAITYYLGFKVNSAEYKVMGLAPYGKPIYAQKMMEEMIDIKEDGSFRLNMKYFSYDYALVMTNGHMEEFFGEPRRKGETKIQQIHMDIAASVQKVTEEIVKRMATSLHKETGLTNLCMAGGVALNCVANGKVVRETPMKNIFVQPAAGDAGGSIGVAMYIYNTLLKNPRKYQGKRFNPFLGPGYTAAEVKQYLDENGIKYDAPARPELMSKVANLVNEQQVIGWFQGRMEFGPRALGNRSIIADPRNPANKDVVNLKIKFRESFRPFAPSILAERCQEYFDVPCESPYMLLVAPVREEKRVIPAVTHVDHSARIQTITPEINEKFYDLIKEFDRQTGCPVIINTSFNVRGEPIVMTPHDAYMCFMRTNMDYLVLEDFILDKKNMKPLDKDVDWQNQFELD